ncbi:hypothetical protein [Alsobacter soli]|uniref:hypothetical protein n=1 Tax=Alsobacter soli TaxID=2109933 RepID=UPI0011B1FBEE|nr:hypothetical protein [Alsobacter soli]
MHARIHECVGIKFRMLGEEIDNTLAERVFVEVSFVLYELGRQSPEKRLLGVVVVHAAWGCYSSKQ